LDDFSKNECTWVTFTDAREGTAYLAALSRVLHSPRGASGVGAAVWCQRMADGGIQLGLNDPAFDVATSAFGVPPSVAGVDDATGAVLVLDADTREPFGMAEAERRIAQAESTRRRLDPSVHLSP
jgi:hypothetical protein